MKNTYSVGVQHKMRKSMNLGFDVERAIHEALLRFSLKRRKQKRPAPRVRLIALPWDYEIIAVPLAAHLRSIGAKTSNSCVWPSRDTVGRGEMEIAPIAMSYNEEYLDDVDTELVIINSFVDTTTVIESMLTYAHPLRDMRYQKISVIAPIASVGSFQAFSRLLRTSEQAAFSWTNTVEVGSRLRPQVQAKVDDWLVQALELGAPEELHKYFPKTVLTYLNEQPRPPEHEFTL
ncbi:hypothetical protein H4S14_004199 [Agrobacterium vitis]|nr:hypothetical protein [Agrobacterium vitis]MBE1440425.1 hypothetical protein [Agrobacterium vitis]